MIRVHSKNKEWIQKTITNFRNHIISYVSYFGYVSVPILQQKITITFLCNIFQKMKTFEAQGEKVGTVITYLLIHALTCSHLDHCHLFPTYVWLDLSSG